MAVPRLPSPSSSSSATIFQALISICIRKWQQRGAKCVLAGIALLAGPFLLTVQLQLLRELKRPSHNIGQQQQQQQQQQHGGAPDGEAAAELLPIWHSPLEIAEYHHNRNDQRWKAYLARTSAVPRTGAYLLADTRPCRRCLVHFPLQLPKNDVLGGRRGIILRSVISDNTKATTQCQDRSFCLVSRIGDKAAAGYGGQDVPNQDRAVLYRQVGDQHAHDDSIMLLLLADGHGVLGHDVAELVLLDLPPRILSMLDNASDEAASTVAAATIRSVLHRAFLETDRTSPVAQFTTAGATTMVILQYQHVLTMASVGDSTGIVARWDARTQSATILHTARLHKPADADERARIESHGGFVYVPPDPTLTSRVLLSDPRLGLFSGSDGMALAMSRCLGDGDGKAPGLLSAEPDIWQLDLRTVTAPENVFVVVATDGVTDFLNHVQMVNALGAALFSNDATQLSAAVQTIMDNAAEQWRRQLPGDYRDDMTLTVTKILAFPATAAASPAGKW